MDLATTDLTTPFWITLDNRRRRKQKILRPDRIRKFSSGQPKTIDLGTGTSALIAGFVDSVAADVTDTLDMGIVEEDAEPP